MGFLSRISPFKSRKTKLGISSDQFEKGEDPLKELRALRAKHGRVCIAPQVTKELREMATKFTVISELDQRSLPPIPHPIHRIVRCSSEPYLSPSAVEIKQAYTVKVIERTKSARPAVTTAPGWAADFPVSGTVKLVDIAGDVSLGNDRPAENSILASDQCPAITISDFSPAPKQNQYHSEKRLSTASTTFLQLYEDYSVISLLELYDDDELPDPRSSSPCPHRALHNYTEADHCVGTDTNETGKSDDPQVSQCNQGALDCNPSFHEGETKGAATIGHRDNKSFAVIKGGEGGIKDAATPTDGLAPQLKRKCSSLRLLITGGQELVSNDQELDTSGDVVDWMEKQLKQADLDHIPAAPQFLRCDLDSPASFESVSEYTDLLQENLSLDAVSSAFCTPASRTEKVLDLSELDVGSEASLQSRRASQVFRFITKAQHPLGSDLKADKHSSGPLRAPLAVDSPSSNCSPNTGISNSDFEQTTNSNTELGFQRRNSFDRIQGSFRLFHLPGRPKYRERQLEQLLQSLKEEVNSGNPIGPPPLTPSLSNHIEFPLPKMIPRKPIRYGEEVEPQVVTKQDFVAPIMKDTKESVSVRPLQRVDPNVLLTGECRVVNANVRHIEPSIPKSGSENGAGSSMAKDDRRLLTGKAVRSKSMIARLKSAGHRSRY